MSSRQPRIAVASTPALATGPGANPVSIDPRVLSHLLEVQEESLQLADSVDRVIELVLRTVSSTPGVGAGAIYILENAEPKKTSNFEGPEARDLPISEVEAAGLARRALREKSAVRQSGVSRGTLAAIPLRSAQRVEGVVVASGNLESLERFFAHAGPALVREVDRRRTYGTREDIERRALAFERATEIVEGLATGEDFEMLAQRIVCAAAASSSWDAVSLWMFRTQDGRAIEIARKVRPETPMTSANGGMPVPPSPQDVRTVPEHFLVRPSFEDLVKKLPRWGGASWWTREEVRSASPKRGDLFIVSLAADAESTRGFLLAEASGRPSKELTAEDLTRFAALARLVVLQSQGQQRFQGQVEALRAKSEHEADVHRMKSQFIAAVSHELRTPLTSISAYAETLRNPDVAAHSETRERFLRIIHDESRRLTRIVDDILDLATLEGGRVRMAMRRVNLAEVIQSTGDVIRPLAEERGVKFVVDAEGSSFVHGDPDLLEQMAVNLLENAIKFSSPGGTVSLGIERDRSACRIVVSDAGPGIPADKLDRIFEQFYQVDGSNTRRHGGAGLGLAICRSIALWHDGRIWVESEEGRGSRFIVSIPRVRARSGTDGAGENQGSARDSGNGATQPITAQSILELVVEVVAEILQVETVALLQRTESGDELVLQAALGLGDDEIREIRENIHGGVPITFQGRVLGRLYANRRRDGLPLTPHDAQLLSLLADRTALVLRKISEIGDSPETRKNLERALRGILDVRRHYEQSDIGELVLRLCARLGVGPEEAARIHYAAMVRDVGMTRIPFGVIKKPTRLSARDRAEIQRHPEESARILRPIEFQEDIFDIVLAHHEEPSGGGYPRGAVGPSIPRGARILAVVDAYSALLEGRPYRPPVSHAEALGELRRCAGQQFDAEIVEALAAATTNDASANETRKAHDASAANDARTANELRAAHDASAVQSQDRTRGEAGSAISSPSPKEKGS